MIKINAIKIQIVTPDGLYGFEQSFQKGLNVIRGNNSSGKSSLFQAILYALGLEELLGGKNEKTMQSVLKDQVEFPDSDFHKILQSEVYLEIENNEAITVRRSIISPTDNPKLVNVYYGKLLTGDNKNLKKQSMFIHDKGGAADDVYGFHAFISNFLGWNMPEVINNQGQSSHLYIQQIAPTFMIEQKSGWSDFFATMPYYGIKQATSRIIEYILNMDVFENQRRKTELSYREEQIKEDWKTIFIHISNIARDTRYNLQGLNETPSILDINEVLEKVEAMRAANAEPEVNYPEVEPKAEISIDDFAKVQLRVGEVLKCEPVPKAKKLLCSQIRVGSEVRQIVSGIAMHYKPEEMVGKKVAVITNLKPVKICGVLSEGMILAASDNDGNLSVLTVDKDILPGSEIC